MITWAAFLGWFKSGDSPSREADIQRLLLLGVLLCLSPPALARGPRYQCQHEVLPGERLGEVARRYRIPLRQLRALSGADTEALNPGHVLAIPSRFPCPMLRRVHHQTLRGETRRSIARKYRMSIKVFNSLNPGKSRLKPGQPVEVVVEELPGQGARSFVPLPNGPGYAVRKAEHAYGTPLCVSRLTSVLAQHHARYPEAAPLRIHDLSKQGGGRLRPHRSHRQGRDVDISLPLCPKPPTPRLRKGGRARAAVHRRPPVDIPRTWDLLHALLETGDVTYMFLDYRLQKPLYEHAVSLGIPEAELRQYFQFPRTRRSMVGIVRHEPGHGTHVHVRFRADDSPLPDA